MINEKRIKFVNAFSAIVEATPGQELVIFTQGEIITGKLPNEEDFENNSTLNAYTSAIKEVRRDDDKSDDENGDIIGLTDVTIINGRFHHHLSFMIIFTDQILGVSIGSHVDSSNNEE